MNKKQKSKAILQNAYPQVARHWHPTRNGNLTSNDVTVGSGKIVWWKCPAGDDHVWQARIAQVVISFKNQSSSNGCPVCRGLKIVLANSLAVTHPALLQQWHPTKNDHLTPYNVTRGSHKKVWWKCDLGDDHEWIASIKQRSHGNGCPMCRGSKVVLSNCLATVHPTLTQQWHPTKNNNLTPYNVHSGSHEGVWWKCDLGDDHEWLASIDNRINGSGCPVCSGAKVTKSNCFSTTHSEIVSEWHPTKNNDLTSQDVTAGSGEKVWWKCAKGNDHEWRATINSRVGRGNGCPVCSNKLVVLSNCLAILNLKLSAEWHADKNTLTPYDVVPGSVKKVWWKCSQQNNHEWRAAICDRVNGSGCPYCVDQANSRGVRRIEIFLKANGIAFEREKKFDDLRSVSGKNFLRFDFFLKNLGVLIEFDGEQHFRPVILWGGESAHRKLVDNDRCKDAWAKERGYRLIRISFRDEHCIEDILATYFLGH